MNEKEFLVWFKKYLSDKSSLTERQMNNLKLKLKEVKIDDNSLNPELGGALESLKDALDNFNSIASTVTSKAPMVKTRKEMIPETASSTMKAFKSMKKKLKEGTVNKNIFWKP
jgi:Sec-independent protein translocase protein TatA